MRKLLAGVAVLALLSAGPAFAQQSSTSDSTSGANSGSASQANNQNSNGANTNTSTNTNIGSDAHANSGSTSTANTRSEATGGTSSATSTGGSSQASNGSAASSNNQGVTINSVTPEKTTATVRTVPNVYAPALTTTLTETCMGSTSLGGSGVGVGVTIGTTWHDKDCVRRLNAREMSQTLGDRDAARALLCEDEDIRKAYESVGIDCHMRTAVAEPKEAPAAQSYSAPPPPPPPPPAGTMAPIPNPAPKGERG